MQEPGHYTESVADQTDHFVDVFVRENFVYCYDLWKFTADAILFREIHRKERDVLVAFSGHFGLNEVKYARITITHVCFIALRLAGSLGRCLNTRHVGLVFKHILWTRQIGSGFTMPFNYFMYLFNCTVHLPTVNKLAQILEIGLVMVREFIQTLSTLDLKKALG